METFNGSLPDMTPSAIRIELPAPIMKNLMDRGEPEIEARRVLSQFSTVNEQKPIVIGDDDRRRIEKLIARNIGTPAELIKAVERLVYIQVGDVQVPLSERMLTRLRVLSRGKEDEALTAFVVKSVTVALQRFAGVK